MDGKTLLYDLRHIIREDSDSGFLDDYTSYRWLNEAAVDFALKTGCLRTTQSITTTADTATYDVNSDFIGLYLRNSSDEYIVKYTDGSSVVSWIPWRSYEEIIYENSTTSQDVPSYFTIFDNATKETQVTGTATSAGTASGGQCTLTDSAASFTTTEMVSAGDVIHNTTDGSTGVVLSVTSGTALVCALFGGTDNDFTSSDAYVIQPQGRFTIQFAGPPDTSSETVLLYYLQRPAPVYSDYGIFRFPSHYSTALVKYAAALYKYRDDETAHGDKLYAHYLELVKKYNDNVDHIHRRKHFRVKLKRRQ